MPRDDDFPVRVSELAAELGVSIRTIREYGRLCGNLGRDGRYTASQADAISAVRAARYPHGVLLRGPISARVLAATLAVDDTTVARLSRRQGFPTGEGYTAAQAEAIRDAVLAATEGVVTG